jgi:hypothetical protein
MDDSLAQIIPQGQRIVQLDLIDNVDRSAERLPSPRYAPSLQRPDGGAQQAGQLGEVADQPPRLVAVWNASPLVPTRSVPK